MNEGGIGIEKEVMGDEREGGKEGTIVVEGGGNDDSGNGNGEEGW